MQLGPARSGCLGRLIGPDTAIFQARLFPERTSNLTRIDASLLPPSPFVAGTVQGAVVDSTERHREFVACLAAERARLDMAKMMWVRRCHRQWETDPPGTLNLTHRVRWFLREGGADAEGGGADGTSGFEEARE